jgi:hypothetical protein
MRLNEIGAEKPTRPNGHNIAVNKEELLRWLDKAKLFVELGYVDCAHNVLQDVRASMEQKPEMLARPQVIEDTAKPE